MEVDFQILDCDYIMVDKLPIVRLFGKTKEGKTVCTFFKGFLPYFYILPKNKEQTINYIKNSFENYLIDIKEEEKFLPIGFQEKKTKLLKVYLNDPSKVASIREEIKNQKFVEEVYEADVLFKYRFMCDLNLSGMKWARVIGDATNTTIVKTEKVIAAKNVEQINVDENVEFKYMSVDIEVIPGKEGIPNSKKDEIAMISLSFYPSFNGEKTIVLVNKKIRKISNDILIFQDEKSMLQKFLEIIDTFNPDFIVGYNINNFDLPFIFDRLKSNKLPGNIGRCKQKQFLCKKIGSRFKNSVVGRVIVDVYELVRESVGKGQIRIKRYGLGDVSKELLKEDKVDISHSEITKYWNGDETHLKKLIEYSKKDAELVLHLLLKMDMLDKYIELAKVSGLLLQDVLNGGESTRVENLLLREFDKNGVVIPCKPSGKEIERRIEERESKGIKGALVLEPDVGLHTTNVIYLDFKAMYPSIFIAWNICSTTLLTGDKKIDSLTTPYGVRFVSKKIRDGIIPKILNFLIEEREKIKKKMVQVKEEEERKILDAKQYALKIMANAFYGYTGYIRAKIYVLDIANAITSCGRELIQKTKNIIEKDKRFKVIYGDTDSVMVKLKTNDTEESYNLGKEIEKMVNEELKGIIQIKIENIFRTMLILSKKRYVGWSFENGNKDKIVMKGIETVRRDWCALVEETLFKVLEIILKEQNPRKAFDYVKDILIKLERNEIPIDKLVITKGISKPLIEYKGVQPHVELVKKMRKRDPTSAPGVGDRIGFVIIQGPQLISDRAEDPEYVKKHNLKIDSRYYVENQVLPPLERVFEAIGINKTELVGIGKQLALKEILKQKKQEISLKDMEGVICCKCNKTYRRVPLIGKCFECGGEIVFYFGEERSKVLNL